MTTHDAQMARYSQPYDGPEDAIVRDTVAESLRAEIAALHRHIEALTERIRRTERELSSRSAIPSTAP